LKACGEVRRFADDRLLLRRAFADQIADDDQSCGDPNARLQCDGIKATDSADHAEPRPHRPLRIVLMGARVAEIHEHAIAHVLGDKPLEASDDIGDGAVIGGNNLAQILGIEPRRKCGRADEITEHHCQLPPLGISGSR
jgi:hypothetical protein